MSGHSGKENKNKKAQIHWNMRSITSRQTFLTKLFIGRLIFYMEEIEMFYMKLSLFFMYKIDGNSDWKGRIADTNSTDIHQLLIICTIHVGFSEWPGI